MSRSPTCARSCEARDLQMFADLPLHEFDPETSFCTHCCVPEYAVVDEIVIPWCGSRRVHEEATA